MICGAAALGLVLCIIGYFLSPKEVPEETEPKQNVTAGNMKSSNIVAAGRDVHQTIYHHARPLVSEGEQALPDFFYDGNGSQVTMRFTIIPSKPDRSVAEIKFLLRFENQGQATAYNVGGKMYGCWIHGNPVEAVLIDSSDSVGRTAVNQGKSFGFTAWAEPDSQTDFHSLNIRKNTLVVLIEIHFGLSPEDFSSHKNDPIWLTWTPELRNRTSDSTPADISIAKPLIDRLKAANAIPTAGQIRKESAAQIIQTVELRTQTLTTLLETNSRHLDTIAKYPQEFRHKAAQDANFPDLFEIENELIQGSLSIYRETEWDTFRELWQSLVALNREINDYNHNHVAAIKNNILKITMQTIPENLERAKIQSAK